MGPVGDGRYVPLAAVHLGRPVPTYRCRDTQLGAYRLLWDIPLERLGGPDGEPLRELRRRARTLEALDHPNLARVFAVGVEEERAWLITELPTAGTLEDRLDAPMPPRRACELVVAVCRGLQHAHDHELPHLALSPSHVLLGDTGEPRISGLAAGGPVGLLTAEPPWTAPEQASGAPGGPASDVHAAGLLLIFLATGGAPRVPAAGPDRDRWVRSVVPEALAPLVTKALAPDPGERHARPSDLAAALEAALPGLPEAEDGPAPLHRGWVLRESPLDADSSGDDAMASEETVQLTAAEVRRAARRSAPPPAPVAAAPPPASSAPQPAPEAPPPASRGPWLMAAAGLGAVALGVLALVASTLLPGAMESAPPGVAATANDTRVADVLPPTEERPGEPSAPAAEPEPTEGASPRPESPPAKTASAGPPPGAPAAAGQPSQEPPPAEPPREEPPSEEPPVAEASDAAPRPTSPDEAATEPGATEPGATEPAATEPVEAAIADAAPSSEADPPDEPAADDAGGAAAPDEAAPPAVSEVVAAAPPAPAPPNALIEAAQWTDATPTSWVVRSQPQSAWHYASLHAVAGAPGRAPDGGTLEIGCTGAWVNLHILGPLSSSDPSATLDLRVDGELQQLKVEVDASRQRLVLPKAKKLVRTLRAAAEVEVGSAALAGERVRFAVDGIDEALRPLEAHCSL